MKSMSSNHDMCSGALDTGSTLNDPGAQAHPNPTDAEVLKTVTDSFARQMSDTSLTGPGGEG